MNVTQNEKRKQRKTKNAYVDVDSVNTEPGFHYCNWIQITKQQLKERENVLLKIKIDQAEAIVNETLSNLNLRCTLSISQSLISETFAYLYSKIDEWKGVNVARTKAPMNGFRQYFRAAKNWWDQTKKKIFGALFWVRIFKYIHSFVLGQLVVKQPSQYIFILLRIISSLFYGTVKYCNTKPTPLINGGTFICSDEMCQYLLSLNDSLQFKSYIVSKKSVKIIMGKVRTMLDAAVRSMSASMDGVRLNQVNRIKKECDVHVQQQIIASNNRNCNYNMQHSNPQNNMVIHQNLYQTVQQYAYNLNQQQSNTINTPVLHTNNAQYHTNNAQYHPRDVYAPMMVVYDVGSCIVVDTGYGTVILPPN